MARDQPATHEKLVETKRGYVQGADLHHRATATEMVMAETALAMATATAMVPVSRQPPGTDMVS